MKKTVALLLTAAALLTVSVLGVSADFTFSAATTDYNVVTASEITFAYSGQTTATAIPRGDSTLECLIDGDNASGVTNHDQDGIVLVCNDFIKPDYEEDMAMADQPADAIPSFSFALKYDEAVTFDAVYLSLFYQMMDCVSAPGENKVVVETSEDGKVWVPVGTDGAFYYRNNQPEYTGAKDPYVEEIAVPLGEDVEAQYVRLTFRFKQVPETETYWTYYTNVYEWCGFTELAVAQYEAGDEPIVMDQSYATAPALELSGMWTLTEEGMTMVVSFEEAEGVKTMVMTYYEEAAFAENGVLAEAVLSMSMPYTAGVDEITVQSEDGTSEVLMIEIAEDALTIDDGVTAMVLEPFVPDEEPGESSSGESSDEESTESEESADAASSEEESKATSSAVSKPAATSSATSTPASSDDGGFPVWAIALIVVGVVALIVIVVIVIKKRK